MPLVGRKESRRTDEINSADQDGSGYKLESTKHRGCSFDNMPRGGDNLDVRRQQSSNCWTT